MATDQQSPSFTGIPSHDLLTPDEVIAYLRLDAEGSNPIERLRNLVRFQKLPVLKRGKLRRFRRSEIDGWLEEPRAKRARR